MTATPGTGGQGPPVPAAPVPGVVPQVPGQIPMLEALAVCVHPDGTWHPAGLDGPGFPITCDQWRVHGARLRWVVSDAR